MGVREDAEKKIKEWAKESAKNEVFIKEHKCKSCGHREQFGILDICHNWIIGKRKINTTIPRENGICGGYIDDMEKRLIDKGW